MPQASDELRDKMILRFGDLGDGPPWEFLKSQGYTNYKSIISPPSVTHKITEEEGACIDFLCDEWDWDFRRTRVTHD